MVLQVIQTAMPRCAPAGRWPTLVKQAPGVFVQHAGIVATAPAAGKRAMWQMWGLWLVRRCPAVIDKWWFLRKVAETLPRVREQRASDSLCQS